MSFQLTLVAVERGWLPAILPRGRGRPGVKPHQDLRLVSGWWLIRLGWRGYKLRAGEPLDDVEEDGRQEDAEGGHAEHAAEDGQAQGSPHLGAGALGQDERDDAGDERERRHQDRPEPESRGLEGGLAPGLAGFLP